MERVLRSFLLSHPSLPLSLSRPGTAGREADVRGACVCPGSAVDVGGTCVPFATLVPAVIGSILGALILAIGAVFPPTPTPPWSPPPSLPVAVLPPSFSFAKPSTHPCPLYLVRSDPPLTLPEAV